MITERDHKQVPPSQRARMIALWKEHHPLAASEAPSEKFQPLALFETGTDAAGAYELWMSDVYTVRVRREPDKMFGSPEGMIRLGIDAADGTARHDWRDMQAIKNQLAGPECEAVELFPAESRLCDPSNYYVLYCFPGIKRLKIGTVEARRVWDADEALAPQRAFPK